MYIAMNAAPDDGRPTVSSATDGLRLGYVLAAFPVLSETFVTNQIRAVRALGHGVLPIAIARHDGPCQPDDEGFRLETLHLDQVNARLALGCIAANPRGAAAARHLLRRQRGLPKRSLLLAGARVALLARRHRLDHLHAHFAHAAAATAIVAARLAGITCSFIGHGYDVYSAPSDLAAKIASADLAIATCHDMAADFRALAPDATVTVIPCGVDPCRFHPADGAPRTARLLAIGRLVEQKGYETLLAALAALAEERRPGIDIVGAGPLAEPLARQSEALGLGRWVTFLGPRPHGWIAEHGPGYQGLVAPYVICANGDRDTGPMVVKEAMAMGLPVVGSALMGIKEYVTPDSGRLVAAADAAALAEALVWLATLTPERRRETGLAGRQRILEHYTLELEAQAMAARIAWLRHAGPRA